MNAFTLEEYQQFHLNQERVQHCYQEKWFKIFVPSSYEGLELSMAQGCQKLLSVAEIQGGLGWTVNLGAGANWFSGFFEESVAKELFSPKNVVIAGSGASTGEWRLTENGYEISGQWSKCTGAHHATLFSLNANAALINAIDPASDTPFTAPLTMTLPEVKTFVVPREQVQLSEEKWPIMGMRNSSSFGIHLNESGVPKGYEFQINVIKNNHHYAVLHIPFQSFARLSMTASYLGVIYCLVRHCQQGLQSPAALALIEDELLPLLKVSEKQLYSLAVEVEDLSLKGRYTDERARQVREILGNRNLQIFQVVQSLFLAGGLPFIEEDTLIHWAYRDVLTAVQHFMVKP